jgi:DNA-binding NarL/FixJ family response regulator
MSTVLLVEDDPRIRGAVRTLLSDSRRHSLLGEADSVAGAIALASRHQPEVLLLDLGLPDGSGIDVLRAVGARARPPLAMVLTIFDDDAHLFDALRAGAVGYLLKDDMVARLVPSVDDLASGGSPMSPSIARRVLASFCPGDSRISANPPEPKPDVSLTPRERRVTELLAQGSTYDEIGVELDISTNTVRSFIRSIYEKLQVQSKAAAVREAVRRGIVKP